jgi:hypothetical protein
MFGRLEDFISLAKQGKYIQVSIDLKKQIVIPKVNREESGNIKIESEFYVLLGEYSFDVEGKVWKISKPYMYGVSEESMNMASREKQIANERLKMDFKRLREVNITFDEKYF